MDDCKWNGEDDILKTKRITDSNREKRKSMHRLVVKPHETKEEAMIRRFHDAQRMARFRARKKKALEEAKVLEGLRFNELSVIAELKQRNMTFETTKSIVNVRNTAKVQTPSSTQKSSTIVHIACGQSKYCQLLRVIEELGKDIKLMYAGSKTSAERLKTGIMQARVLIKRCLLETKMNLSTNRYAVFSKRSTPHPC